jgi:hypothetical protein
MFWMLCWLLLELPRFSITVYTTIFSPLHVTLQLQSDINMWIFLHPHRTWTDLGILINYVACTVVMCKLTPSFLASQYIHPSAFYSQSSTLLLSPSSIDESLFLIVSHNYRHKFYDLQKLFSCRRVWAQIEFGGWRWPKEGRQCMCVNIYWYTSEMLVVGRMIYGRLTSINMQGEEHWIWDTHGDMEPWRRPLKEKLFSC